MWSCAYPKKKDEHSFVLFYLFIYFHSPAMPFSKLFVVRWPISVSDVVLYASSEAGFPNVVGVDDEIY